MKLAILGGRSPHTAKWAYSLLERGHEVNLISIDDLRDWNDLPVHKIPFGMPLGYYLGCLSLRKALRRIKPDLLHVHYASGYGTLGRLSGFHPSVLSVWGSDVFDFPYQSPSKRKLLESNLRYYDHVCSTSQVMADQVLSLYPDLARPTVTPFGIDTRVFAPGPSRRDQGCITFGTAKTMKHHYAIDVLLNAFAITRQRCSSQTRPIRLVIAGDGPQKTEMETLAAALQIDDAVRFIGRIPHSQVPDFINTLDVFINPSRRESFGVAVLEASACGVPVITSDAGGLPEVIQPGVTGIMFPNEDVDTLADAMVELAQSDHMREQMGAAGREFVQSKYEQAKCVVGMEDVYRQVLPHLNI